MAEDLLAPLRTHDPARPGLSLAEVRRRGDRRRRRRAALTAAGTAGAVAAVVVGGFLVTRGTDRTSAPDRGFATDLPSSSPTSPPRHVPTVPTDFPLDDGITDGAPYSRLTGPSAGLNGMGNLLSCDLYVEPSQPVTGHLGVTADGAGLFRQRDLTRFRTAAAAASRAEQVAGWFRRCADVPAEDGLTRTRTTVDRGSLGDRSWVARTTFETSGAPAEGQDVVQVVQVGDAVLVTRTAEPHGPGATDLTAFEAHVAREIELLGPVVDAITALVSGTGAPRA